MSELRSPREMTSGHHDRLVDLYQEISRAIDATLRSLTSVSIEMRQDRLRVVRELLLAQSYVVAKLASLHNTAFSVDGGSEGPYRNGQVASRCPVMQVQTITARLNQNTPDAASADAGSAFAATDHAEQRLAVHEDFDHDATLSLPRYFSHGFSQKALPNRITTTRPSGQDHQTLLGVTFELQRQLLAHLAHLPSTAVDYHAGSRPSSSQDRYQDIDRTFVGILQNGGRNKPAIEELSPAGYASEAAYAHDAAEPITSGETASETEWEDADDTSAISSLKMAIGRLAKRASLTLPMLVNLGVAVAAGASLSFWFGASGEPRFPVQSALQEKIQSRLGPSPPDSAEATTAVVSGKSEKRAPTSDSSLEARVSTASAVGQQQYVVSTLSPADLATPEIPEPRASASGPIFSAVTPPPAAPQQKPPSTPSSNGSPASHIGADRNASPSSPLQELLTRPSREDRSARLEIKPTIPVRQSNLTIAAQRTKPAQAAPKTTGSVDSRHFTPILMSLKDKTAALQIFEDLQRRHAAALANKRAEAASFIGPDGQLWYHVRALPAVTKAEAMEVCRALGPEGEAFDCTVAPY